METISCNAHINQQGAPLALYYGWLFVHYKTIYLFIYRLYI